MKLVAIGLNHKTAPVEVREKLSLTNRKQAKVLDEIKSSNRIKEGLVLSTCNRTEFYLLAPDIATVKEFSFNLFDQLSDLNMNGLRSYIYLYSDLEVVRHLYRVVSGLDSLVLGETQILGQVKEAFRLAISKNIVDTYLHKLFTESFRVAKRVRTETKINAKAVSVSYVAVELAKKIFGSLAGETVLILGAGETSELTLKNLVDHGVQGVMVANRTYQRGQKLAQQFDGQAVTWQQLEEWVAKVDIIIASTAAPHYVLHANKIKTAMKQRNRPLFLIDIAVPRDIDPKIKEINGVHLYDIDDLKEVVAENLSLRKKEVDKVEDIIREELVVFKKWKNYRHTVPVIKEVRQQGKKIKEEELERVFNQLQDINVKEKEVIEDLANRLVNKLLHHPTIAIKDLANSHNTNQKLKVVKKIFDC